MGDATFPSSAPSRWITDWLSLSRAVATGGAGSLSQAGQELTVTIDGTVASTYTAPSVWASWPIMDPYGRALRSYISTITKGVFSALPPATSGMRIAFAIADDPDPSSATSYFGNVYVANGATQADPDIGAYNSAMAETLLGAANAGEWQGTYTYLPPYAGGANFSASRLQVSGRNAATRRISGTGLYYYNRLGTVPWYLTLATYSDGTGHVGDTATLTAYGVSLEDPCGLSTSI